MKKLTIEDFFVPITKEDINKFEKENNMIMPNYLRKFFFMYNGASIKECIYKTNYIVNSFLPLLKLEYRSSVEDFLPWVRDDEFLIGRIDLIPFTIDPGGIPCLVSIGGSDEGAVYYSAVGLDEKPLRKIADSFEEFIDGLKSEEEI